MTQRAVVPWKKLKLDVALLGFAVTFVGFSLWCDLSRGSHNYFQRAGAVMVLVSGLLAYRGLGKHWIKTEESINRDYWLRTSRNQQIIDIGTLVISILGTAIWGYGDLVFAKLF